MPHYRFFRYSKVDTRPPELLVVDDPLLDGFCASGECPAGVGLFDVWHVRQPELEFVSDSELNLQALLLLEESRARLETDQYPLIDLAQGYFWPR